jgi:hypothetical protein
MDSIRSPLSKQIKSNYNNNHGNTSQGTKGL